MNATRYREILDEIKPYSARLVAVSKTRPVSDIEQLYQLGQKLFGENRVLEIEAKQNALPPDIEWHLIGHLQTNKVKYIAPYIAMIHSVDSMRLLEEINKQAEKNGRIIPCLLQIHIAQEETKYGLDKEELRLLLESPQYSAMKNLKVCGLMGMATFTTNTLQVEKEFAGLKELFENSKQKYFADKPAFKELSMGMSADYKIALKHGATLIRIGSDIFGSRA